MCLTQIVSPDFSVNECGLFFKHSPLLNFLQKVSVKYCLLLVTELGFLNCFAMGNDLTSTSIKELFCVREVMCDLFRILKPNDLGGNPICYVN